MTVPDSLMAVEEEEIKFPPWVSQKTKEVYENGSSINTYYHNECLEFANWV